MTRQEPQSGADALDALREENRQLRQALESADRGRILLQQHEEFSRLLELSKRIVSELDVARVFDLVAENAREIVSAELVIVPMLSEARDKYTYVAASGADAGVIRGTSHLANVGMCGWVLQHERALLFGETSPYWMAEKTPWEEGQQSAVLVPLIGRKGIIGGLSALGKLGGGPFTRHDLDLLTMFANQVSIAIENALLFEQRLLAEKGLKAVNDCFLSFGIDPRENIEKITATTGEILNATFALYTRRDGDALRTLVGWHLPPQMPPREATMGGICGDVLEWGGDEPLIIRDLSATVYADSDPMVGRYGLEMYVGYPVSSVGQPPTAVLAAVFRQPTGLSSYQLSLLRVLGRAAAVEEERQRADSALRASETRFRAIIENSPVGILAAEIATGRFRYANPVICEMLAYERDELLTLGVEGIHPEDDLARVRPAFSRGEAIVTRCLRKDGTQFSVEIKGVWAELDGVPCLVGFFTDITDRQLLESERIKTQKLEAVGKLAGGIAHDFNNLMQAIFGNIHMAKIALGAEGSGLAMLEDAESALEQAIRLTRQLLTFSKGGTPVKKLTALSPLLESAAKFTLSGSATEYRMELAPDLWPADVDEGQIAQVIQNLVLNASQAMVAGGVVHVRAANVGADGGGLPPGLLEGVEYVVIEIADSGSGIAEENLARVFDPYFTTKDDGSGLGLATSYSIVRNHGGVIDVASSPGTGSTFRIYLPATPGAAPLESIATETEVKLVGDRPLRVLVMDDEASLRKLCQRMLARLGHETEAARHGEEAVAIYRAALDAGRPFDLVILDLTIRGGMGGRETIARLLAIDPEVTAVVSSGYSDDDTMTHHLALGFKACLKKPYVPQDLKRMLDSLIK